MKCLYVDVCYLAESLQCYGYKLDCVLYTKTNKGAVTQEDFHKAINELIDTTKTKNLRVLGG
jgi:meiotically up-regulated gene 157 (Mug157) protein